MCVYIYTDICKLVYNGGRHSPVPESHDSPKRIYVGARGKDLRDSRLIMGLNPKP